MNDLCKTDFENIYSVYLHNLDKKNIIFKILLSFVTAPYIVIVALLTTKAYTINEFNDLNNLPLILNFLILIIGIGMLIPLKQFIEYDDNVMRCARAINNFRTLYTNKIEEKYNWKQLLPVNPAYPKERKLFQSGSIIFSIMSIISVIYILKGIYGVISISPNSKVSFIEYPIIKVIIFLVITGFFNIIFYFTGKNDNYKLGSGISKTSNKIISSSIGNAWKNYMKYVKQNSYLIDDDKGKILESGPVIIELNKVSKKDKIIKKYGNPQIQKLYTEKMFSESIIEEIGTTYGDRLFNNNGYNQIKIIIDKLHENPNTKSATISLIDAELIGTSARIPCLTTLDFKIRDNKLHIYSFFRSQNVLNSYGNMYGIIEIQKFIQKKLECKLGTIFMYISSPHYYKVDEEKINYILDKGESNDY